MIEISTLEDERVAPYRSVADPRALSSQGLFVAEGRLIVPRLLAASSTPGRWFGCAHSVLLSPSARAQMNDVLAPFPHVPLYVVPQAVMNDLVGFNIHRGCLALGRRPETPLLADTDLTRARRIVLLEGVNNPDNIGGIFRSAAAFSVDLIALGPGCGDPLYRKAIRTSMGATLEVPFARAEPWAGALETIRSARFLIAALTTAATATPLHRFSIDGARVALLAGAEGSGLSDRSIAQADAQVTIPMSGRVDSLNVSTALAVALYHVSLD